MGRVKVNPRGIRELLGSHGIRAEVTDVAESVLAKARDDAPVLTGAYRDGLHIEQATVNGVVQVRVSGGSDHDIYVEAETGNLVRALDAAGP